ncbi:enoyl-[acyl-carrier-protein] reductase [NADH]-like [Ylistrum balloti]|uniref:enoyl-[acyl-carrier-protein] reductase [NADH]-like n=1 Tax=Ylistrum balloti TaxID=509963 RepID=UPI002905EB73|nr:enoyl-[acyl-carrier-protein] reductase [NADH]-like [Ylistrum balloti]
MVIKPKIKGFICTTAHPKGCLMNVEAQIKRVQLQSKIDNHSKINNVLVVGGSTGYGLASRIVSSFGLGANTYNVCLERPPKEGRTASPGWYNTAFFEKKAIECSFGAQTIIGDCFSDETKNEAIKLIKKDKVKINMVIYSVASPKRVDPESGTIYKSSLKPIGRSVESVTINPNTAELSKVNIDPAPQEEIENTIKVMGGEDWKRWIDFLEKANVLSDGFLTFSYSYMGPEITQSIYRQGTIGQAKLDLEKTAQLITDNNQKNGKAIVVVNKALVTHASSAIPILPLYVCILYKVMKEKNCHEDCLDQIDRFLRNKVKWNLENSFEMDDNQMIRMDDLEMSKDVQSEVKRRWDNIEKDLENADLSLIDQEGYLSDFLKLFGFGMDLDYEEDVSEMVEIQKVF